MDNEIKVSVFCLTYNQEQYIRETLEGFVNQKTNFKFEVLVHDDASTDSTADIIREYEAKYPDIIKPVYQSENKYSQGIHISNQILLPMSKGKYIAFCEGDDYWCDPYKLQKQYDAMESNSDISLCVHNVQSITEDGQLDSRMYPDKEIYKINDGLFDEKTTMDALFVTGAYPFHTSSYFIRRDVYALCDPLLTYLNGDMAMLWVSAVNGSYYYIDDVMSHRRLMSKGSWSEAYRYSVDKEFEVWGKSINAARLLDELSDKKHHIWLQAHIFKTILYLAYYADAPRARKLLRLFSGNGKENKVCLSMLGRGYVLKYYLCRLCPHLLNIITKIKFR